MSTEESAAANSFLRKTKEKPILTGLVLLAIALVFKWVDTFVLRLDELIGEIILCKALGFILVVVFVWVAGRRLRDIGLHSERIGQSILIGVAITALALTIGYGIDIIIQVQKEAQPVIQFAAIDPKAGVSGGLLFALWLIFGNLINAFMEEGLFRGVMIRLFRMRFSLWGANWLQAFLFALWHLPWVLKWYQTGQIEEQGGIVLATISQFLPMLLIGLFWGYLYIKTNSLWAPWIAHVLNNTVLNLLHITTVDGMDIGLPIRALSSLMVVLLSMFVIKYLARRFKMSEVKPWGQWMREEE